MIDSVPIRQSYYDKTINCLPTNPDQYTIKKYVLYDVDIVPC